MRNAVVIQSHWGIWVASCYASTLAVGLAIVAYAWVGSRYEQVGKLLYSRIIAKICY